MLIKRQKQNKKSYSDKIYGIASTIILLVLFVIFFWPLWFVIIASLSHFTAVSAGEVILWPKKFTLEGYTEVLAFKDLWMGYANTIYYSVVGTAVNMLMTICCAYPLSHKEFRPAKFFLYMFLITMYFGGGLVPTYLVVKNLGLVNTRWAMIIPGCISFYNCLIVRTYFLNSIPNELYEASLLDGANAAQYLVKVVLPLSKPVLAVVGLYYFVGHWNDYYTALIYIYKQELYPLQSVLKALMGNVAKVTESMALDAKQLSALLARQETMKYSVIVVAMIPVLILYPFVQKYFVKGVMVGAVKG